MARRKALWQEHFLVWGQSAKTGRRFRIMTRSVKYVEKLFDRNAKCAIIFNNSLCISLGFNKGISKEEIDTEWANIKTFWNV